MVLQFNNFKMNSARLIFFITLGLFIFGLIMLASASAVKGASVFGDALFFLRKQLLGGGLIGLAGFFIASVIPFALWKRLAGIILLSCLVLLILVFQPIGLKLGGSSSWIDIGFLSFQPSELAKIALIFYLSAWLAVKQKEIRTLEYGLLGFSLIVSTIGILILLQPDLGSLAIIALISGLLFFLGGGKISHVLIIILIGAFLFFGVISVMPEKAERLNTFLNYDKDPLGAGYQVKEALVSVGSGGILGKGLGYSSQKWNFLPEPAGDTIFAIIGEELGFIGASVVLLTLMFLGLSCLNIGKNVDDLFAKLCASGIGIMILVQTLINVGGVLNIIPMTGVTLPLISHGGTSLAVTLFSLGVVVNIARSQRI